MKKDILGIDLGSANTVIYSSASDSVVYSEPTVIAFDTYTHEVKETGFLASKIQGKTPYNYTVVNPVENGLIADEEAAYLFLSRVLADLRLGKNFRGTSLVFSAPSRCSPVNRNAIIDLGKRLAVKEIFIESQAKLAALGAGENVFSPTATLVLNIGAGLSDIAVLSMGEVVSADSTFIAGKSFDEAIRRYLIQNQHLSIGLKSAEYLKMRIGNLSTVSENRLVEIKGRDTITSLPSSMIVSSGEIRKILEPLAQFIALKVTDVISLIAPELSADLLRNGLILTGGGALLAGLRDYLQRMLSIPVRVAEKPLEAVALGMSAYAKKLNA
jgi:rod shape-determining protein MreB